jgi:hypothetical protein
LIEMMAKFFGKAVVVLIDEIDAPLNRAFELYNPDSKEYEAIKSIMLGIHMGIFKTNKYVHRILAIGIFPLPVYELSTPLPFTKYDVMDNTYA